MQSSKYVFRQLFDHTSYTFTYILGSAKTRQAIIIDPVIERIPLYTRLFKELDLRLVKCVDTHIHADHVSANGALREQTGCAIVMPKQSPVTDVVGLRIEDGDQIEVRRRMNEQYVYCIVRRTLLICIPFVSFHLFPSSFLSFFFLL
jgi:glyoxylase-like metal-dependent hydrolase (beta-lactamase superfamily II)